MLPSIHKDIITLIQTYLILVCVLNIFGNATLIYALRKTKQTKPISFKFIIFMSASDLTNGTTALLLFILVPQEKFDNVCWVKHILQLVLSTCVSFSFLMILLIAFDRYLHIKSLRTFTFKKKYGYIAVICCFLFSTAPGTIFIANLPEPIYKIITFIKYLLAIPFYMAIFLLYYKACKELRTKTNQLTRSITRKNDAFLQAAILVTLCAVLLTISSSISNIILALNKHETIMSSTNLEIFRWLAMITMISNAFCTSVIFISHNKPIRRFIKNTVTKYRNRVDIVEDVNQFEKSLEKGRIVILCKEQRWTAQEISNMKTYR